MSVSGNPVARRDLLSTAVASAALIPLTVLLGSCVSGPQKSMAGSSAGTTRKGDAMGAAVGDIEVFRDPKALIDAPTGIIGAGSDIWFTSIANGRIGRVAASSSAIETFADPAGNVALPANIFPAADGRVWFTCLGSNRLGAIDPSAQDPAASITTYTHPELQKPVAMKASSDGRLWFSLRGSNAIGSVDPRAAKPMHTLQVVRSELIAGPSALFIDKQQGVWWVNADTGTIGHLDSAAAGVAGSVTAIGPWPQFGSPRAWAMGPHGRLWLTTQDKPGLLTFDPAADDPAVTVRWSTDKRLTTPDGVWFGIDGALWFVDTADNSIGRHDPDTTGEESWLFFGSTPDVDGPFDIKPAADPNDGTLWFTNKAGNSIGRIRIREA